ncbi:LacI family transcriptional regulator [Leifsonia sp. Leaf264]|nr:LacI family transcriptional regulator [Leifsonia sp. Leaf264]
MSTISVRDVAARSGVSIGTVSNALNRPERVAPATLKRVQAAITELGYVPNDAARQLSRGRSTTLGLVVLNARNPFFMDVARGADDAAAAEGLTVTIGNSDESTERQDRYLDLFELQRVQGVLISPLGMLADRIARLRSLGIPSVVIGGGTDEIGCSSVSVDDVAGGQLAARHLLDAGHRRIAFAGGPYEIRQVRDRLSGAQSAIADFPDATLELLSVPHLSVLAGREAGQGIAQRAPEARPQAIFAANDLVALGLLQAFTMQDANVRVPEDIAIIGYDDIDFASAAVVPLSSVRQPSQLIGETAVRILLDEVSDPDLAPRRVIFQPELVVRSSSNVEGRS